MDSPLLSHWSLIGTTLGVLQHCDAVHFFNNGKSAFIVKENALYAYGENHACIINKSSNNNGYFVPFKMMDISDGVKALCTGMEHVTLLDKIGQVFTWGNNDHGQLGDGKNFKRCHPYTVGIPPINQISCGSQFTLALDENKEIWFWGRMSLTMDKFQIHRVPKHLILPDNVGAFQISSGSTFASIVTVENKVLTWGFNECGQLGHGHTNPILQPRVVSSLKDVSGALCATNSAIFLTKDGRIFVTGRTGQSVNPAVPEEVKFVKKIVSISACWKLDQFGVKDENGKIYRWGFHDKTGLPEATEFKDIRQIYADICTPFVYPGNGSDSGDGLIFSKFDKSVKNKEKSKMLMNNKSQKKTEDNSQCRTYMERWCDVKVRLSDGYFMAHSNTLRYGSHYLRVMLDLNSNKKELDLTSFDAATCRTFFKYLYTQKFDNINLQYIPQMCQLAEGGLCEELQEKCLEKWHNGLTRRNIISLYELACKHNAERLKALCTPIISQNMEYITASDEFKKLSYDIKLSLISTYHGGPELCARRLFLGV